MIKVCLTENAIKVLNHHSIAPDDYLRNNGIGLELYNMGPDIIIQSRSKWVDGGEQPTIVPIGIRMDLPHGLIGMIVEKAGIARTGLMVRDSTIFPGKSDELFVNIVNIGERDVQIPAGGKLPLQLLIVTCYNNFQQIQFQDYIASNDKESK